MVSLKKITLENRREMFRLEVDEEQKRFVASNLSSVASCYVLSVNGGHPLPYIIYAGDVMVGFVMIVYGITGYETPPVADGNYCILRLMIDKRYQGRGYGRAALHKVIEYLRTFPAGPAQYCWIGYSAENQVAKHLYHSVGFREMGEIVHEGSGASIEQYAVLEL